MLRSFMRRWRFSALPLLLVGLLGACDGAVSECQGSDCVAPSPTCDKGMTVEACADGSFGTDPAALVRYADEVVDAPGHTGEGFFDSAAAVNGVRGRGTGQGGFDVFSLGYEADDCYITLGWSGATVRNGPGADFAVFENGFQMPQAGQLFMDLIVVELSRDGQRWVMFPHDYVATDETVYIKTAAAWKGFAGIFPVRLHEEDHPVDPFDPELAGGDHFDLDDLPDDGGLASEIREHGFSYIRLSSAPAWPNPDTGAPFVRDAISDGADIDGVYGRYVISESAP